MQNAECRLNQVTPEVTETNTFVFFDDLLENLFTAKKKGWITIWIHPRFNTKKLYNFIDYSYPNIYDALNKIKDIKFY